MKAPGQLTLKLIQCKPLIAGLVYCKGIVLVLKQGRAYIRSENVL